MRCSVHKLARECDKQGGRGLVKTVYSQSECSKARGVEGGRERGGGRG